MTTATITDQDRLTVLKQLHAGKGMSFVQAANQHIPESSIREIAQSHGHPDKAKLSWAIDIVQKRISDAAAATIPAAQHTDRPAVPDHAARTSSPAPAHRPVPDDVEEERTRRPYDATADLLLKAASSPRVRTQRLGAKISDLLVQLRDAVVQDAKAERAAAEARAAKDREKRLAREAKEKAQAEIRRLEQQLAAAKAKLRGTKPRSTTTTAPTGDSHGSDAKVIRSWARANGVECPDFGRVPADVREQYNEAQVADAS